MHATLAVRAEHVTKQYRLGAVNHRMLTHELVHWTRKRLGLRRPAAVGDEATPAVEPQAASNLFKALDDISFEVNTGDALGIIGGNGAGKSTLLKLIARVTLPSAGKITVRGRMLSMLEIGTGFVPDLSGRENVFLNGMLLGMTKSEIQSKFDEIVAFAEVPQFIDTPVKRYSSGMQVRLAFSVAAHFEPELLIIDEVLAVGDARFQKRCMEKMHSILRSGRTVLFVSHNMTAVSSICNKGMLLDRGRVAVLGTTSEALMAYERANNAGQRTITAGFERIPGANRIGDDYAELVSAGVHSETGELADEIDIADPLVLSVVFDIAQARNSIPVPNFVLNRMDGTCAFVGAPPAMTPLGPGRYRAECRVPGHFLNDGIYYVGVDLTSHADENSVTHFSESKLLAFRVLENFDDPTRFRYSQRSVISGGVRPTELFNWTIQPH